MPLPIRIRKEIGFTHREILRLLPRLADAAAVSAEGTRIVIGSGARNVVIVLEAERERVLSETVRIPYTPLELAFYGYSAEDRDSFERRFDRLYFKGGG